MIDDSAPIGIIGGSGFYTFVADAEPVEVSTPFGPPSDGLTRGCVAGRELYFLPRHGVGHQLPPHAINYRANVWALYSLGVEQVLAPCAVGSLTSQIPPGSFAIPDQIVDHTRRRVSSFVDSGMCHVSFADPYCPDLRSALANAVAKHDRLVTSDVAMVVIEGPRFSTRAESEANSRNGWSLVNMTGMPEAVLARELAMCYATLALVTDYDAGVSVHTAVRQPDAVAVFRRNVDVQRQILQEAITTMPRHRACGCGDALNGLPTDHVPRQPPPLRKVPGGHDNLDVPQWWG